MRGKAVTVNVRMPKAKRGKKRARRGPYQTLKSTGWNRGTAESVAMFGPTQQQANPEQLANRKKWHYRGNGLYSGRGGFWSDLWGKTAGFRHALGGAARSGVFGPVGQAIGGVTGALGIGDYETGHPVVSNDIVDHGAGQGIPVFAEGPNTVVISHKEYIADIFGPVTAGTFQNQVFGLNPALVNTFPWLAQVAANYDEYTFHQMIFTFRSTVTDFVASNGQVGSIIMATQYNSNDTPFASKADAMEYDGAVSGKVSEKIMHGVECDPTKLSGSPGKYTRAGPVAPGEDIKTYDLGQLNVSVSNTPGTFSNQALGELWVSYTVELRKPKFFVTRGLAIQKDAFYLRDNASIVLPTTLDLLDLGEAQQNRIGGMLVTSYQGTAAPSAPPQYPAAAGTMYYVFPDTFSGDVEILLACSVNTPGQAGVTLGSTTPPPGITQIKDLWTGGQWVYYQGSPISSASPPDADTLARYHIRVTAPTSAQSALGQDNVLTIASGATLLVNASIEVQIYNTGFNSNRTGEPVIQNPQTEAVEPW
jgi:hypothetical protein